MKDDIHNPMRGILVGFALGLVFWSAVGLYLIYDFQPVEGWTCVTDTECESEALRRGLPID